MKQDRKNSTIPITNTKYEEKLKEFSKNSDISQCTVTHFSKLSKELLISFIILRETADA